MELTGSGKAIGNIYCGNRAFGQEPSAISSTDKISGTDKPG